MSGDDRELARDRRLVVSRWLAVGSEDLRVARLCLDAIEPSLWGLDVSRGRLRMVTDQG